MNRSERRKLARMGKEVPADPSIRIKKKDIDGMKAQATKEAAETAFLLMLAIPATVIHNHYGKLMRKQVNGKSRIERFTDMCIDLYCRFQDGEVTLEELQNTLYEQTGIQFRKERKK